MSQRLTDSNRSFEHLHSLEWLETNGLGGYASGTVSGAHSRRYHGLLVSATNPPVGRTNVLSKLDETLVLNGVRFELGTNQYAGAVHPQGYSFLKSFERNLFPEFVYQAGGVELKKTIAAVHGENTVLVLYEVLAAPATFTMELLPLYACRDFHSLSRYNAAIDNSYRFKNGVLRTRNYESCPEVLIAVPGSRFEEQINWYYNFEYAIEKYRGQDCVEDLYTHGKFVVELRQGETLGVVISTEQLPEVSLDAVKRLRHETSRRRELVKDFSKSPALHPLVLGADQFIVKRGSLNSVIAGYHWFADWGRDTMISLPGLCLSTGRFEEARNILQAFADSVSKGMLPNRFPDYGEEPEYNTIDASLWYFNAVYKYYRETKDTSFLKSVLPVLQQIIDWHIQGTRYNIRVDPADGLLYGGTDGVQLTWMDAKIGDWVVTPRTGKAVEINALWYNALSIMEALMKVTRQWKFAKAYQAHALQVKEQFESVFWNEENQGLYDFVDGSKKNSDVRPNQLYAIALPFPVIEAKDKAEKILSQVTEHLYTPRGLRSLSPKHRDYKSEYIGGAWQRDSSYHQGTVWSFLVGVYVDALVTVRGGAGRKEAVRVAESLLQHLDEACIGSVSEIFDGKEPFAPKGAMAQAWGVAELLRVCVEYALFSKPATKKTSPSKKQESTYSIL